ncbi:hypothetical protein OS190_14010 [Sulfitobacter sp. F26204]|uniref:hypothetical protein n=1 Tax=Sulfitobacter sp. F26204 TaxID=2996014 RepID=UPI00225DF09F|nr:hypothetical protein [Sulfitobacter sp. F26204]MCX7560689.1 hypothetical protein [Sulfitobacter sp. F26204]
MKRRTFLGSGLGVTTVAAVPAVAQDSLSFSLVTDRAAAATTLAARMAAMSDGRIIFEVKAAGTEAAPGFLDSVASGEADLFLTSQDAFVARNPAFGLFSSMPGGMSASELESWIMVADGRMMWDALGEEFGIKSFSAGDDGAMPLWSREPINGLADLSSGPVGSTGLGLQLLNELGIGDVVDVMSGLDFKNLVAFDGFTPSQMAASGLLSSFPHMTTPNAGRPSATLGVGINLSRWTALPEADQFLIERCIMAEHGTQRALALHNNVLALNENASVIIEHETAQDVWDAQIAGANAILSKMFDAGDLAADAADAYLYFINDVAGWSAIGETAYFLGRKEALSQ